MKKTYILMSAFVLTFLAGPMADAQHIRLMTYNVGAFGKELDDSAPMIARMIAELGAETVALNELDSCNRRHDIDQVQHLADDFNDTPDSPVIRQMSRDWTLLSPLGDSYSAKDPHTCIDYIFLLHNRAAVRVTGGAIASEFNSGDVTTASDHLPLYIEVVLF